MTEAINVCRMCGNYSELETVWNLASSPYGDLFMESREAAMLLPCHELSLVLCRTCSLLQLGQTVDASQIYSDYLYESSVTVGLSEFYQRLAARLARDLHLGGQDLVVDVGSNDGSGLRPFAELGLRIVGIEPAKQPARTAEARGIPTVNSFLNASAVADVTGTYGRAKLVCANAVLANVPQPIEFMRHLSSMLERDGTISVVTGYHPDQFSVNMFDYINHDHLTYFSVANAVSLAAECDLELVSAERVEHKGGSIHFLFRRKDSDPAANETVNKMLQRESWLAVQDPNSYREFALRIHSAGRLVREFMNLAPMRQIPAVGASISTTHLMSQFEIGDRISCLFDDDSRKVARYSPSFGIPVRLIEELPNSESDVAVILSWQHTDVLVHRVRAAGYRGRLLVPLPKPHVVDHAS